MKCREPTCNCSRPGSRQVSVLGLRGLELLYKAKVRKFKGSWAKILILLGTAILVILSTACGKHRAQVQAPVLHPKSAPNDRRTESGIQQTQPIPPASSKVPNSSEAATIEPSTPEAKRLAPPTNASPGPLIRIGLITAAREVQISSSSDYFLMEKSPEASRLPLKGKIEIRVEQEGREIKSIYQIQVASFALPENALELQKILTRQFTEPITIRENSAAGTNQVRIGEFTARKDAHSSLRKAYRQGMAKQHWRSAGRTDCLESAARVSFLCRLRVRAFFV
jgi:hypothetical protein